MADIDERVFELYDEYCHGRMERREFLAKAAALCVGGLAMAQALLPRYARAQTVSFTDERIKAHYVTYPSPGGNSGTMKGYLVQPAGQGPWPSVLVIHETRRLGMSALAPGETKERDLSWLDWSRPVGLSLDGKSVLFYVSGEGGGPGYSVYVRGTDGSPAVRLGEGQGMTMSPDGKSALALLHKLTDPQIVIYPTGAGQPRPVPVGGLRIASVARFLPDGKRFLLLASEPGKDARIFVVPLEGGKPRPVTPERSRAIALNAGAGAISPDGSRFIVRSPDGNPTMFFLDGRPAIAVPGIGVDDALTGWAADGRGVYVQRSGAPAARIERLDLATGRAEPWLTILPPDPSGIIRISSVFVSPDEKSYVYAYSRNLCELFVVEGLR
jgi:dipeptidyl aminopeptidase/acylaminoacyl peptidase